jgi:hypothetical protein
MSHDESDSMDAADKTPYLVVEKLPRPKPLTHEQIRTYLESLPDVSGTLEIQNMTMIEERPDPDQPCAMRCGRRIGENPKQAMAGLICPRCAATDRFVAADPRIQNPR